jgi:hypothetical protein
MKNAFDETAGSLAQTFAPAVVRVAQGVSGFLQRFNEAEGAGAKFRVVMDTIKNAAEAGWKALSDAVRQIDWGKVADTVGDGAKQVASVLWKNLQAGVRAINWGEVGRVIGDGLVRALNSVSRFLGSVNWGDVGRTIARGLADFLKGVDWIAVAKAVVSGLIAVFRAQASLMLGIGKELGGEIVKGLTQQLEKLGEKIRDGLGDIKDAIGRALDAAKTFVAKKAIELALKIIEPFSHIPRWLGGGPAQDAKAALQRMLNDMNNTIEHGASKIPAAMRRPVEQGIAAVRGQAGAASSAGYGVGAGLASGMSAGIASGAAHVAAASAGLVRTAYSAATRIAEIKSPSELFAKLGRATVEGYILGIAQTTPQIKGKMADAITSALEAARNKVAEYQDRFVAAFDKLGEGARRAFDAKTQAMVDSLDAKFQRMIEKSQRMAEALTPAERALEKLDKTESERSRRAALASAQEQLASAQALGVEDPGRAEAILAAQESLHQAQVAIQRAGLEERAAIERQKREQRAAEEVAGFERTRNRLIMNLEEQRRLLGEKLQAQLETLRTRLAHHPGEWGKMQSKVVALLRKFGADMETSGELLGKAFARGMDASAEAVEKAARNLARIVARYVPHSPAEKGPLSKPPDWESYWTDGFNAQAISRRLTGVAASASTSVVGTPMAAPVLAPAQPVGTGGIYVTVNAPNYVGTREELARAVTDALVAARRRGAPSIVQSI